ncbi:MAPEG family protein [Tropicimonas sp. S265A]|uniref:MAPEG family protein n=1 Tax=Tropicimonas sp. S265A TaxID=3415134 RepID=UPI003C7E50CC
MTPELTALATLVAFQIVLGIATTAVVSTRTGTQYLYSSREATDVDLTTGLVGRMHRARINTFEALIYFTPTVAIIALADASSATTVAAAWTFVAARALYVFCYAFDLVPWRTYIWTVGILAVAVMLGSAVL